jgi:hypothetical protein
VQAIVAAKPKMTTEDDNSYCNCNKVGESNHDDAVIALALANEGKPIYTNMFDSFAFID